MDATGGYHTKWYKPDAEKQTLHVLIYMQGLEPKNTYMKNKKQMPECSCIAIIIPLSNFDLYICQNNYSFNGLWLL